ncbi:hypothetical protein BJ742DRAFT_835844 [Cladochytrium replicatum]|nr:hypothetical protein BJ742DRAFT_835844 [Cladochytrium replicatum]
MMVFLFCFWKVTDDVFGDLYCEGWNSGCGQGERERDEAGGTSYNEGAQKGYLKAKLRLAQLYCTAPPPNRRPQLAVALFLEVAKGSHNDPDAQNMDGRLLKMGIDPSQDDNALLELNDEDAAARIEYRRKRNEAEAVEWYRKAIWRTRRCVEAVCGNA